MKAATMCVMYEVRNIFISPVRTFRSVFLLASSSFLCLLGVSDFANAECLHTSFRFAARIASVETHWTLSKNSSCRIRTGGTLDNLVLSKGPERGFAGVNNSMSEHGFAYKPNVDFVGTDHFQVTVDRHFTWSDKPEKGTIDVDVKVSESAE